MEVWGGLLPKENWWLLHLPPWGLRVTRAGWTSRRMEAASGRFQHLPKQLGGVAASKQGTERQEGKASGAEKLTNSRHRWSQKCEQPVANNERQLSFSFPPKGVSYNTESTRHGKSCQVAKSRLLCGAGTLAYAAKAFWGFARIIQIHGKTGTASLMYCSISPSSTGGAAWCFNSGQSWQRTSQDCKEGSCAQSQPCGAGQVAPPSPEQGDSAAVASRDDGHRCWQNSVRLMLIQFIFRTL